MIRLTKYCCNPNGRFMHINSNKFGMNRGKTKIGQIFYTEKKNWNELRKYASNLDLVFVPITYKPCYMWNVNGKKRKDGEVKRNIKNCRDHSGSLVRKGEKWKYYESQFYVRFPISKHCAYDAVSAPLRKKFISENVWFKLSEIFENVLW